MGFDPARLSAVEARRSPRATLAPHSRPLDLIDGLAALADDGYRRGKSSRDYPPKKREPPPVRLRSGACETCERTAYARIDA